MCAVTVLLIVLVATAALPAAMPETAMLAAKDTMFAVCSTEASLSELVSESITSSGISRSAREKLTSLGGRSKAETMTLPPNATTVEPAIFASTVLSISLSVTEALPAAVPEPAMPAAKERMMAGDCAWTRIFAPASTSPASTSEPVMYAPIVLPIRFFETAAPAAP